MRDHFCRGRSIESRDLRVRQIAITGASGMPDNRWVERRQNWPGQSPMVTLQQLPASVVLERIPIPVLAVMQDGTILFANTAFAEMLGYSVEEVLSLNFEQIFTTCRPPSPCCLSSTHWRTWLSTSHIGTARRSGR